MRLYKFRAKNVNDGKWYLSNELGMGLFWLQIQDGHLDIKTLGQYIERDDSEDTEMYEGDIMSYITVKGSEPIILKILYSTDYSSFIMKNKVGIIDVYRGFKKTVIGNIHDNPEILKEADSKYYPKTPEVK